MRNIIFIFIFSINLAHAQKIIDTCKLKVQYHALIKRTIEEKKLREEDYILEIGNNSSKIYSSRHHRYLEMLDSLEKINPRKDNVTPLILSGKAPSYATEYRIYKNYPEEGTMTYTDIIVYGFIYEEPMPQFNWDLEQGDTTIIGYQCKKATATYNGREWTAWYTVDIPYSDGPWKMNGLPGLILYAHDSGKDFNFTCTGIENGNETEITFINNKYQKCTPKELQKEFTVYWKDQTNYTFKAFGLAPVDTSKFDMKVKPKSFTYVPIEFYE